MKNYSYVDAWADYRRRIRSFFAVALGGMLFIAIVGSVSSYLEASDLYFAIAGGLWLACTAAMAFRLQLFRCPRCKEKFFFTLVGYWPYARKCSKCGFKKWQIHSEAGHGTAA